MFEMNTPQFIGVIIGVLFVLGVIGKLLLEDWNKKKEKLEEAEKTRIDVTFARLDEEIKEFSKVRDQVRSELLELYGKLNRNDSRIEILALKIENSIKEINSLADRMKSYVRETVRSEVIQLTKELMLVREKKDGKS